MISIIIPTYNGAAYLQKYSLPSLLKQTYSDWEALIIDDGSSDNSKSVAQKWAERDKRFRFIEQANNLGLAAALNLGIREARGDLIAVLEHDDIWHPEKLLRQAAVFKDRIQVSSHRAAVYDNSKKEFCGLNKGNFSCLMLTREAADIIFPLPEENKKYLGIEDGLVAARLELAKSQGKILNDEFNQMDQVLAIMNYGTSTLSGQKDARIMMTRYQNAIKLFSAERRLSRGVEALLIFWRKHYYYNLALSLLPGAIRKIAYRLIEKIKELKNRPQQIAFRSTAEHDALKEYRTTFD